MIAAPRRRCSVSAEPPESAEPFVVADVHRLHTINSVAMRYDRISSSTTPTELALIKDDTINLICQRTRLSEDLARRIVEMSRTVDQAMSLAELMR